jgi:hypothetical protein
LIADPPLLNTPAPITELITMNCDKLFISSHDQLQSIRSVVPLEPKLLPGGVWDVQRSSILGGSAWQCMVNADVIHCSANVPTLVRLLALADWP